MKDLLEMIIMFIAFISATILGICIIIIATPFIILGYLGFEFLMIIMSCFDDKKSESTSR